MMTTPPAAEGGDNQSKTALDTINHSFRTPLTLLMGALDTVRKRSDLPAGTADQINAAYRNGVQLLDLINSIIDLSRADQGRMRSRLRPIELSNVTESLAENFRDSVSELVAVRFTSEIAVLPPIYMDQDKWTRIVMSLLTNAVKFTYQGSISLKLKIVGNEVVLTVSDTGLGIPEDEIPKVFDKFYRIARKDAHSHSGTGVGLAVVKEYVQSLSGQVNVASTVGEGTTFEVRIPSDLESREGPHLAIGRIGDGESIDAAAFLEEAVRWLPERDTPEAGAEVSSVSRLRIERPAALRSSKPKLVVVEDNAAMANFLRQTIGPFYDLVVVEGGNAALQYVSKDRDVDLLVVESIPFDMTAKQVMQAVHDEPLTTTLPILILADRSPEEGSLVDLGADDYVIKPFTAAEILARIRLLLERTRLRRETEAALRQAQRMEAIGQITGGISHDFSNLLVAIIANLDLAQRRSKDPDVTKLIGNAMQASQRGARLTNHLLSFSQKRDLSVEAINTNDVVTSIGDLLVRALGGMVGLTMNLGKGVWSTTADPHSLELALINLAINALEAMPDGGQVTITTRNMTREQSGRDFVRIEVQDTGSGMTPEVIAQAFDPYFTTKEGNGSGLGLTQVRTDISQFGGDVEIESTPGKGTSVFLYLPRAEDAAARATNEQPEAQGQRTLDILIVDDDDDVRDTTQVLVEEIGHRAATANSGRQALAMLEDQRYDLVILDYAMPGMSGIEVAARIKAVHPGVRILFSTGYVDTKQLAEQRDVIMHKPFDISDVIVKISQAMAKGTPPRPGNVVQMRR